MNTITTPRIKAYSYLRFSTPEQLKGDSFRRQTSMAEAYAAAHDLDLDNQLTFNDLGVSAFRGKNAEAGKLAEFLEAVKVGAVLPGSVLLVEALDRLSRLTPRRALRVLTDIIDEGITVVTLNDGKSYTTDSLDRDPMDLMMAVLLFMRANEESATKARRLKAAWEGKRQKINEVPLTTLGPAWLKFDKDQKKFVVVEERAELVRRIFSMTLAGIGYEQIAYTFNTEGHDTFGRSKMWHRSYIKKILESPGVTGILVPHLVEHENGRSIRKPLDPIPGYYPAVVDEDTFQRVQAMRSAIGHPKTKGRSPVNNILSGLARCPHCGGSMMRVSKGSRLKAGHPYLVCAKAKAGVGCVYRAVRQAYTEDAMINNIGFIAGTAPTGVTDLDKKLENVDTGLAATHGMIDNILDLIAIRPSPASTAKLRELEDQLEQLQRERQQLAEQHAAASGPLVAKRLEDLTEALTATEIDRPRANAVLRQVFNSVTIDWVTGHLRFEWKHGGDDTDVVFALPHEVE